MKPTSIYVVAVVSSNWVERRQVNCFVNRPSKADLANLADDAEVLRVVSLAEEWPAIGVTTLPYVA